MYIYFKLIITMANKPLSLSIVIPVYNEQRNLDDCLGSISKQSAKPDEVIVVDNNSTDNTVKIAQKYPFVKILREQRQGQIFAQATGFDIATGAILARIDGDTILPVYWTEKVKAKFSQSKKVAAVTGGGIPYDVHNKRIGAWIFRFYHRTISVFVCGQVMLWGSNLAFRAELWPRVKKGLSFRTDIWEDYEMSFILGRHGAINYMGNIDIGCSYRSGHKSLLEQTNYQFRAVRTVARHLSWWRTGVFFILWSTMYFIFPITVIDRHIKRWKNSKLVI